jgi:hypothetical protein
MAYRRIDYLKLSEEAMRTWEAKKTVQLPWPGYNRDQQFSCPRCGTMFDTSAGRARHQVNECQDIAKPAKR